MVQEHQVPTRSRSGQLAQKPAGLRRGTGGAIRFVGVAVEHEETYRPPAELVVTFVAGQREIVEVWAGAVCTIATHGHPVVVAQNREEMIGSCPRSVAAGVGIDKLVVILADVRVNGRSRAGRIVVVASGDDEVRVPALDQVGHILLSLTARTVVTDHGEANRRDRLGARSPSKAGEQQHGQAQEQNKPGTY